MNFARFILVVTLTAAASSNAQEAQLKYSFVEIGSEGAQVRILVLGLTDEPASTCLGGSWKKVLVASDREDYAKDPAYKLEDGKLEILLVNGLCDAYDSYIGNFSGQGFEGEHVLYGWSSKVIGKVTGSVVP